MGTLRYALAAWFGIVLLPSLAGALPVISLTDETEQVIGGGVEVFLDETGELSFEQVWADSASLAFKPSDKEVPNFGFSDSAIWMRFTLQNTTDAKLERLFSIGYPLLDDVKIEIVQAGEKRRLEYGDLKEFSERDVYHRHFIVPLTFNPKERVDIRMRVQSESSLRVPLTVWEPTAFYQEDVVQMLLNGLYYGLMLVMALYNAFVYFSIRERSYLVYVCFVLSAAIAQLAMSGLSYQFLWPTLPWWGGVSVVSFLALGTLFAGLFTLEFLQLKQSFPRLARAITVVVGLSTLVAIGSAFLPYGFSARAQVVLIVCAIPLCITAGVVSWRAGSVEAKFYSIAWFSFLGGAMLLALTYVGVLPANALTTRGHEVGGALLVVLLSLALARKLKSLQEESELLATELFGKSEELAVALEGARSADQLKGQILANLSHELRTPLNALINIPHILTEQIEVLGLYECGACGARFLDDGEDDDEGAGDEPLDCPECEAPGLTRRDELKTQMPPAELMHLLQRTKQSGNHLAKTFTDMLEYAKLESGTVRPSRSLEDPKTLLEDVSALYEVRAESKDIQFELDIPSGCPLIGIDRELSELLLNKLIDNAVEFAPNGSVVSLKVENNAQHGQVIMHVTDSGIGIAPEHHTTIFESFRQVDGGHTRTHPGVGLGLAIATKVAELQGWKLTLDSTEGHGATFSVAIPI